MKKRLIAALLVIVTLISLMCVSVYAAKDDDDEDDRDYAALMLYDRRASASVIEDETAYFEYGYYPIAEKERAYFTIYNENLERIAYRVVNFENDEYNSPANGFTLYDFEIEFDTGEYDMPPGDYMIECYVESYEYFEWITPPSEYINKYIFSVVADTCKGNHDFELTDVFTKATCTKKGRSYYTCTKCGYEIVKYDYGHEFDEGAVVQAPTPDEDGIIQYTCALCGVQNEEVLSKSHAAHITKQPKTAYAGYGESIKVSLKAKGDGLKYQWYFKNEGGSKYSKSSITGNTYSCTMTEKSRNRRVLCIVTDKYGNEVQSKTVVLRMSASILTQPKNTYTKSGSTAKVTVEADGDDLTYEWYIKNAGQKKYTKSSVTKATYSCKMNDKAKDRYVYCVVTDKYGNSVKSKTVVLRMAATITTQPKDVSVEEGKSAKVTVEAVGDELTYTWYFKNEGSSKFSKSSITKATYSAKMSDKVDGRQVYCVVTDKYGKTVTSNTVTLSMK